MRVPISEQLFCRKTVKALSRLLKMKYRLMNTVNPWKKMARGREIWSCRLLLLLLTVIYAYTGYVYFLVSYIPIIVAYILLNCWWCNRLYSCQMIYVFALLCLLLRKFFSWYLQKSSSRWYIKNFSDFDAKMVHL